jgi:hypothetical protein
MQQERHTCSKMSYRITDVEYIGRAKKTQLNLTGEMNIYKELPQKLVFSTCLVFSDIPVARGHAAT